MTLQIKPEDVEYKIGFIDFADEWERLPVFLYRLSNVGSQLVYSGCIPYSRRYALITLPNCILKAREHGLNEVVVETNGGGSMFL